jgi:hypothetical protein
MRKLLLSYMIIPSLAASFGQRVWDDGVAETYQTTEWFKDDDGEQRTRPVTPDWYQVATLNEAQLEAIREAVAGAKAEEIPVEIPTVDPRVSDPSSAVWQVDTPDGLREIRVAQWGPLDPAAEPLNELVKRMGMVVAVAAAGLDYVPD